MQNDTPFPPRCKHVISIIETKSFILYS